MMAFRSPPASSHSYSYGLRPHMGEAKFVGGWGPNFALREGGSKILLRKRVKYFRLGRGWGRGIDSESDEQITKTEKFELSLNSNLKLKKKLNILKEYFVFYSRFLTAKGGGSLEKKSYWVPPYEAYLGKSQRNVIPPHPPPIAHVFEPPPSSTFCIITLVVVRLRIRCRVRERGE